MANLARPPSPPAQEGRRTKSGQLSVCGIRRSEAEAHLIVKQRIDVSTKRGSLGSEPRHSYGTPGARSQAGIDNSGLNRATPRRTESAEVKAKRKGDRKKVLTSHALRFIDGRTLPGWLLLPRRAPPPPAAHRSGLPGSGSANGRCTHAPLQSVARVP